MTDAAKIAVCAKDNKFYPTHSALGPVTKALKNSLGGYFVCERRWDLSQTKQPNENKMCDLSKVITWEFQNTIVISFIDCRHGK